MQCAIDAVEISLSLLGIFETMILTFKYKYILIIIILVNMRENDKTVHFGNHQKIGVLKEIECSDGDLSVNLLV